MIFYWYRIFNRVEFNDTGLVSRTVNLQLEGRGRETVLLTNGNTTAMTHDGTLLPLSFLGHNPFIRDGKAVYVDSNENVWLGFEVPT